MKIVIEKRDLVRETFHCGGPGGQKINKVETGVRFTHKPTGIVSEGRAGRTQGENTRLALEGLVGKLRSHYQKIWEQEGHRVYREKSTVSFGSQIRTYYLVGQQRVIDHRTGITGNPREVLDGKIDLFLKQGEQN